MLRAVAESAIPPPGLASSLPTAGSLPKDQIARDLGRCLAVFDMRGPYVRYARRRPRRAQRIAYCEPEGRQVRPRTRTGIELFAGRGTTWEVAVSKDGSSDGPREG